MKTGGTLVSLLFPAAFLFVLIAQPRALSSDELVSDEHKHAPNNESLAFFENEIRPILANHCYECHSGVGSQEADLRLDHIVHIKRGGGSGPAAIAGQPDQSLLIEAVRYRTMEMPPNGKLPATDIAKLEQWVQMGMPWPESDPVSEDSEMGPKPFQITEEQKNHWAFNAIQPTAPPTVQDADWSAHPIDRFLFQAMEEQGLSPNERASRETLLRRASLSLTGLPPTAEQLDDFLQDDAPDAWHRLLDRLLASPQYGERWGRHWLDVVRYADTAGDASDYPIKDAYKYRNYVIRSLNQDKPYDLFLKEQIAGDLLTPEDSNSSREDLLTATSYLALARRFGYNDTTFHYFHLTIHDLIDNLGQGVLGVSVGCARCHDHKFEPVSAKDYYALYGIFSSSKFTFTGAEEVTFPKDLVPLVSTDEIERLNKERNQQLAELNQRIAALELPSLNQEGTFENLDTLPAHWGRDPELTLTESSSSFAHGGSVGTKAVEAPRSPRNLGIRRPIPVQTNTTTEKLHLSLDFRNLSDDGSELGYYRVALDHPENSFNSATELFVNAKQIAFKGPEGMQEIAPLEINKWYNLQMVIDWSGKSFSGKVTDGEVTWTFDDIPINANWAGHVNSWIVDGHGTENVTDKPRRQLDNWFVGQWAADQAEITSQNIFTSNSNFYGTHDSSSKVADESDSIQADPSQLLGELRTQRDRLQQSELYPTVCGVLEGTVGNAKLQLRGEPERLGEVVPRGFPEFLGGWSIPNDSKESGRRELANWLVAQENPLTYRVLVNRIWQHHFGRGIVATANDFGVRGQPPTNQKLLDYLVHQFQLNGYSIKSMHRLLMTSMAYQISSRTTADSVDPDNAFQSRFNRRRMDAESIRDSWLMLSGKLDHSTGHAHPFPPVSSWRFSQHVPFDATYPSNRRTVYLMTQRIKKHPFLALFDGPDTNTSTAKRDNTITPAQALHAMNSPELHEISMAYAHKLTSNPIALELQLKQLFVEIFGQSATETEIDSARRFLTQYTKVQLENRQVIGPGQETTASPTITPEMDIGAEPMAALIRVLLSSNRFLFID